MSNALTTEYIISSLQKEGYKLISPKYINNKVPLEILCPNNHSYRVPWIFIKRGDRCSECIKQNKRKSKFKELAMLVESNGYTMCSTEYINNSSPLHLICPKNHVYVTTPSRFKQGIRCMKCAGKEQLSLSTIKQIAANEGYNIISTVYINARSKLDIVCPKNHKYSVMWTNFKSGNRCPVCSGFKSEELTRSIMESIFKIKFPKKRLRMDSHTLELDGYNEENKIAFEYQGIQHYKYQPFFHNNNINEFYEQQKYDAIKREFCKASNINLIEIPYTVKNINEFILNFYYSHTN